MDADHVDLIIAFSVGIRGSKAIGIVLVLVFRGGIIDLIEDCIVFMEKINSCVLIQDNVRHLIVLVDIIKPVGKVPEV